MHTCMYICKTYIFGHTSTWIYTNDYCDIFVGTIYNDLGLIFTQRQKYDKAVSCFESALPMVEGADGDKKQMAVIFQNLGATFNFLGNYQKAVEYHEKASDMYGM